MAAGDHLGTAAPQIYELLRAWQSGTLDPTRGTPSFVAADKATVINAYFAPLGQNKGNGPVLIFLEDASLLAEKVQQIQAGRAGAAERQHRARDSQSRSAR